MLFLARFLLLTSFFSSVLFLLNQSSYFLTVMLHFSFDILYTIKKFYKNLNNPPKLGRLKTVDSKAMHKVIDANPASSTWRVSGELVILQSSVLYITFMTSAKASKAAELSLMFPKYYKTFDPVKNFSLVLTC